MAHLVDGVLSAPVLIGGAVLATAGIAIGLRRLQGDFVPYCGLMSAAFFVASLIHVPVGPSNVHLILSGLLGIVLGWAAVPAIFVGLLLQALFFGYGGLTVLGVNTVIMALPALICFGVFGPRLRRRPSFALGAAAGGCGVLATCLCVGAALALSGREFLPAATLVVAGHLPVLIVEAAVTGTIVSFLQRVRPDVLMLPLRAAAEGAGRA